MKRAAPAPSGLEEPGLEEPGLEEPGLELVVRGMRLHIHHQKGAVMDPLAPTRETKESITVTPNEIIYQRRLRVLEHAQASGNVSETCRVFGISRTRFYEWRGEGAGGRARGPV